MEKEIIMLPARFNIKVLEVSSKLAAIFDLSAKGLSEKLSTIHSESDWRPDSDTKRCLTLAIGYLDIIKDNALHLHEVNKDFSNAEIVETIADFFERESFTLLKIIENYESRHPVPQSKKTLLGLGDKKEEEASEEVRMPPASVRTKILVLLCVTNVVMVTFGKSQLLNIMDRKQAYDVLGYLGLSFGLLILISIASWGRDERVQRENEKNEDAQQNNS